jgi:hypothetical protein
MKYEDGTTKFSQVVTELRQMIGVSPKEDYERLDRAANEARVRVRASTTGA